MELAPRELLRWHVQRPLLGIVARPHRQPTSLLGNTPLPDGAIRPGAVCYCGGVGEEIDFERRLVDDHGAQVWLFDPTPRAVAYMERKGDPRLTFKPVGLWDDDTTLHFAAPANPAFVSHSVMQEGPGFDAPCRSIPSLMAELGHDRIDLLKLNIEGAEHVVLEAALEAGVRPAVIALTWEGDRAFRKALRWTARLRDQGYRLGGRNGWWFTYQRD